MSRRIYTSASGKAYSYEIFDRDLSTFELKNLGEIAILVAARKRRAKELKEAQEKETDRIIAQEFTYPNGTVTLFRKDEQKLSTDFDYLPKPRHINVQNVKPINFPFLISFTFPLLYSSLFPFLLYCVLCNFLLTHLYVSSTTTKFPTSILLPNPTSQANANESLQCDVKISFLLSFVFLAFRL
jgi:uncharacterized protein with PQ loop repeat